MAERDLNRAVINAAGELRSGDPLPDTVPITESGPVLNGALLEGLPGPCVPIPQPTDNALLIQSTSCSNARSFRSFELINNITADYLSPPGSGRRYTVWMTTVSVVRNAPFRVFFDFTHPSINGAGISIVQSQRPLFEGGVDTSTVNQALAEWFELSKTRRLRDTRSDGGEITTNGNQIGRYGVDAWSQGQPLFSRPVQQLFFGSDENSDQLVLSEDFFVGLQDPTPVQGQSLLPIYSDRDELRVSGYGFLQTTVNCSLGEYVTVFVIADTTVETPTETPVIWQAVLDYEKLSAVQTDTAGDCDEQIINAPSRAYQQGGVVSEWVGGTQFGYFGQTQRDGETVGAPGAPLSQTAVEPNQRFVDNIYFPYEAPPVDYVESIINGLNANNPGANLQQGYFREPSRWAGATGVLPNVRQAPRLIQGIGGAFSMPTPNRTVEIKGYFRAPVTGTYEFYGAATDGLWVWVSSTDANSTTPGINRWGVDDLGMRWDGITEREQSGGEFFVEDGFTTGTGRNYGRNNYVLRVGQRTAGTSTQLQSNGIRITLKEGSYYFVRILSGAALTSATFRLEYQVTAPGGNIVRDTITFGGRSCQGDSGPAYTEPGNGTGPGGSVIVGPTPGGGGSGGGGGFELPWWDFLDER